MIVLDNDVLVKLGGSNPDPGVVDQLSDYSREEWTIPAIVAFEFYRSCNTRAEIRRAQRRLNEHLDRIVEFDDRIAAEAAYLDGKLESQEVGLDPVDLLHLATAHAENGTFVTHNKRDFDKRPIHEITDVATVRTS